MEPRQGEPSIPRAVEPATASAWVRFAVFFTATSGSLALVAWLLEATAPPRIGVWSRFVITMSGGLFAGHLITAATVDRGLWRTVGLGRSALRPRTLALGTALGAAAVGVPSLALLAMGWLRITPSAAGDWGPAALLTLATLAPAAMWEELFARGYLFALIRERLGARRAIVVTAGLFGMLHLLNAGATSQSIALVTLAGIFLGAILVATGSLYATWLAHLAWNFVMAGILHTSVSGTGMRAPNYQTIDSGPDWATGGGWGPEAGLFTAVALLVGIVIILRRQRQGTGR